MAAKLMAYHGIRDVSPVPPHHYHQLERRINSKLYAAFAEVPGKDTEAIRDFLSSKVPEEERKFINELENDAGNIAAWGTLKLTEDGRKDVQNYEGIAVVIEDVVEWSCALPEPHNIAH